MPELSRFFGIIIRMYVEAGPHHSKHFHAYYQESSVVVGIEPIAILSGSLPIRQQRFVEAWAEIHQQELLDNWTKLQSGGIRQPISPLE